MFEEEWEALEFEGNIGGIDVTKEAGTTDYVVDNVGYEFCGDNDPLPVLIHYIINRDKDDV